MRAFFTTKNESLLQSLVGDFFKSLFSGLVVAGAALVVLGSIQTKFETWQTRAALQQLKNEAVSKALADFSKHTLRSTAPAMPPFCSIRTARTGSMA